MQETILFTFEGKRKHIFRDKTYKITLYSDRLEMREENLPPKYVLLLELKTKISWNTKVTQTGLRYEGFTFQYRENQKMMSAESSKLQNLRLLLSGRVMFQEIHNLYSPIKMIGEGGTANILLCRCIQDMQTYAVKTIKKENNIKEFSQLEQEVSIMKQLRELPDSKFITLREVFESEINYFIVSDYMQGFSLQRILDDYKTYGSGLNKSITRKIMKQLLEAVKILHQMGMMHRDLKPDNIMFKNKDSFNSLRVIDFGLAQYCDAKEIFYYQCGTFGYIAPEILNTTRMNGRYNETCDIFSCGVIFYQLLTGDSLFKAANSDDLLQVNKRCEIDYSDRRFLKLDGNELHLLQLMLKKKPSERPSAEELLYHQYFAVLDESPGRKENLNLWLMGETKERQKSPQPILFIGSVKNNESLQKQQGKVYQMKLKEEFDNVIEERNEKERVQNIENFMERTQTPRYRKNYKLLSGETTLISQPQFSPQESTEQ